MWILRLGLFELTRHKERADDWVWLVDHTIQLDSVQCLIVVGIRLHQWQQNRHPLEHRNLHFLLLEPGSESTGDVVCEQLLRVVEMTGVPREILTDGGRNWGKGIALFREQHPSVAHSGDILHKTALCLKKILANDDRWKEFLKQCGLSRKHCAKTNMAFLSPPVVRDQARYMNLQAVLKWANDIRHFANDGTYVEPWKVTIEFKWLEEFTESIDYWQRLLDIVERVLNYIRWEGYHRSAADELESRLADLRGHAEADQLIEQLLEFVGEESQAANPDERLLGTTESLESLIGKGKRLEARQSKSGFTKMILAMAAAVIQPTYQVIQSALEAVKTKDVQAWALENLGQTLQAKRRLAFAAASNGTTMG